jgi:uncharacterized protein
MNIHFKHLRLHFLLLVLLIRVTPETSGQSLLWRITGNNLAGTSYLYGTIHITDSRVFEWKDTVFEKLLTCDAFASELDLSMENMIKIAGMMKLPEGETLHNHFNQEEYDFIKEAVRSCSGRDLSDFDKIKPAALISLCFIGNQNGGLESTVDELLYARAKSAGMPTYGLETVEEQISLLDKIPDHYVLEYFQHLDEQDQEYAKLVRCYRKASLDSLLILIEDEESGSLLNDELIRLRNYRMAERIVPIIREQATFIAVGCGHLPGAEGVLALLRRQGYVVEPANVPMR